MQTRYWYWLSVALAIAIAAAVLALRGLSLWPSESFSAYLVVVILAVLGLSIALDGLAKVVWVAAIATTVLGILAHFVSWLEWGPWAIWPGLGLSAAAVVSLLVGDVKSGVSVTEPSAGPHHSQ